MVKPGLRVLWWWSPQVLSVNDTAPVFSAPSEHKSKKLDLGKPTMNPKEEILLIPGWSKQTSQVVRKSSLRIPIFICFYLQIQVLHIQPPAFLAALFSQVLAFLGRAPPTLNCILYIVSDYILQWVDTPFPLPRCCVLVNSIRRGISWGQGQCVILLYFEMHNYGLELVWKWIAFFAPL